MDVLSIATGVAGAGVAYFVYRCARDGVPAVLAWAKAKWSAGKAELGSLSAEVDHVHDRLDAAERWIAQLSADVQKLKGAPAAASAAPAAPAFLASVDGAKS
jgi:hypothetical protein